MISLFDSQYCISFFLNQNFSLFFTFFFLFYLFFLLFDHWKLLFEIKLLSNTIKIINLNLKLIFAAIWNLYKLYKNLPSIFTPSNKSGIHSLPVESTRNLKEYYKIFVHIFLSWYREEMKVYMKEKKRKKFNICLVHLPA